MEQINQMRLEQKYENHKKDFDEDVHRWKKKQIVAKGKYIYAYIHIFTIYIYIYIFMYIFIYLYHPLSLSFLFCLFDSLTH